MVYFLIHWNTTSGLENIKKSVTPHTLNHYVLVGTYVFSEKFRNIRWNTTCVLGKQLLGNRSKNDWVQKNVVIWDMSVRSGQERITDLIICRMSIFPYYKFCHICVFLHPRILFFDILLFVIKWNIISVISKSSRFVIWKTDFRK